MHINRFLIAACAALGIFSACNMAEFSDPMEGLVETVITAEIGDAANEANTRTCIDMGNSGNGYLGILWNTTDCIGVYSQNGNTKNAKFQSENDGVRKANFKGNMNSGDSPWRAYFPYSEENEGRSYDDLIGTLPAEQPFNSVSGSLVGDYKYGAPVSGTLQFNFKHLFSLLRITVNADGTALEGDKLESVVISVTDASGNERGINGSFTFNAENGSWGILTNPSGTLPNPSGTVTMPWTDKPALTQGETYKGFVTVMPTVKEGDKISVTVNTETHNASFTATCKADFKAEYVYNIPLTLAEYAKDPDKFGYEEDGARPGGEPEEPVELPEMLTFGFEVAKNGGKLLDNMLKWSNNKPGFVTDVATHSATISEDNISLMIPYLFDRKLVPTFTVTEGAKVMWNGTEVISGTTEVDFTGKDVILTVTKGAKASRDYKVNLTNTGLPVVVLKHSQTGPFTASGEKMEGTGSGTPVNQFVDFMIRDKDTEWVEDDELTIYNADGTVNLESALCGARLRGNTTKKYPKKPFAIKLKSKASVLGMPEHKRWVLLANWLDHSMIRNAVAFDIAHTVENAISGSELATGIPWNVHGKSVELVVFDKDGDAHYVGNYYLCEQIKIDGDRLDIQDPYDPKSPETLENCGYLLEFDSKEDTDPYFTTSTNKVKVKYKDDEHSSSSQIETKINNIEKNLKNGNYSTAYNDLDINSMVDQFLIFELTMNREYMDPGSVYMFINGTKNSENPLGKLSAGPVWDFDRGTFQNPEKALALVDKHRPWIEITKKERIKPYDHWICAQTASRYGSGDEKYLWTKYLINDPTFRQAVKDRWAVIYPELLGVVSTIESYRELLRVSYGYDTAMWPTNTEAIRAYKSDFYDWSGDEEISNWDEVINNFKTVYSSRLTGMNTLINNL